MIRTTCRAGAALVAAAALTTSCSGGGKKKARATAPTTSATSESAGTNTTAPPAGGPATTVPGASRTTPTTTTGTVPSQATVTKLGTRVDTAQGNVIVYTFEQPGCAGPNAGPNTGIGPQAFYLQIGQAAYHPISASKEPALRATKLAAGQCARGWVTFEIPEGAKPQYVIFNSSKVVAWQIP